jgi:hypothetical protein
MIHHTCKELPGVLQETNLKAKVEYFGDLDATGIRIAALCNNVRVSSF